MTTRPSGFWMSEPTLPRKTLGARPIEQVRHSPTCSQAPFDFGRQLSRRRHLPLGAHEPAGHFVDRHHLLDRQAGVDRLQNALVIIGIEPVIGLHRDYIGAKPPRLAHEGAGLDAEAFGRVAGGNGAGGVRERLHDDDGLTAQGRIFLLFARCKEGVVIEEQPLDGMVRRWIVHLLFYTLGGQEWQARPCLSPTRPTSTNPLQRLR
jgi:hypothetical protein